MPIARAESVRSMSHEAPFLRKMLSATGRLHRDQIPRACQLPTVNVPLDRIVKNEIKRRGPPRMPNRDWVSFPKKTTTGACRLLSLAMRLFDIEERIVSPNYQRRPAREPVGHEEAQFESSSAESRQRSLESAGKRLRPPARKGIPMDNRGGPGQHESGSGPAPDHGGFYGPLSALQGPPGRHACPAGGLAKTTTRRFFGKPLGARDAPGGGPWRRGCRHRPPGLFDKPAAPHVTPVQRRACFAAAGRPTRGRRKLQAVGASDGHQGNSVRGAQLRHSSNGPRKVRSNAAPAGKQAIHGNCRAWWGGDLVRARLVERFRSLSKRNPSIVARVGRSVATTRQAEKDRSMRRTSFPATEPPPASNRSQRWFKLTAYRPALGQKKKPSHRGPTRLFLPATFNRTMDSLGNSVVSDGFRPGATGPIRSDTRRQPFRAATTPDTSGSAMGESECPWPSSPPLGIEASQLFGTFRLGGFIAHVIAGPNIRTL